MAQPLVRSVIEIDERLLNVVRQRVRINCVTMILRRNDHCTRTAVLDGLIATAMTILELKGFGAERFSQELVAETYAEHRQLAIVNGPPQRFNDASKLGWVSRPVADHEAIGPQFEQLLEARIVRNLENFGAFIFKTLGR